LIEHVFRPAEGCSETIPLLRERIAIMREVGFILCHVRIYSVHKVVNIHFSQGFGGSFQGFLDEFQRQHNDDGTALQLVQKVTDTFPSFRDEVFFDGHKGILFLLFVTKNH
jgi:hypothetical protein